MLLKDKQLDLNFIEQDYSYVQYLRKSMMKMTDPPEDMIQHVKFHEGKRDYFSPSLRQINHLIQIDEKPNLELMEPKWELYKISISFQEIDLCKLCKIVT